jgi:hypothetical protein
MNDRIKIFFALMLFIAALILPLVGLGVGWYNWDVETGIYIMVGTFLALFIIAGMILFRVRDLNWLAVSLPYLFGIGYTLSPDLIPLGGDDAAVTALGSVMAYFLALRKDPRTPKWIIIPLLVGAVYIFFGGPIPGGLDELIVNILAVAVAGYGVNRATKEDEEPLELEA